MVNRRFFIYCSLASLSKPADEIVKVRRAWITADSSLMVWKVLHLRQHSGYELTTHKLAMAVEREKT